METVKYTMYIYILYYIYIYIYIYIHTYNLSCSTTDKNDFRSPHSRPCELAQSAQQLTFSFDFHEMQHLSRSDRELLMSFRVQLPTGLTVSFPFKLNTLSKRVKNVVTNKVSHVGIECK
jgi:hypothetical protein